MATDGFAGTHDWSVREIIISKVRFEHRHCVNAVATSRGLRASDNGKRPISGLSSFISSIATLPSDGLPSRVPDDICPKTRMICESDGKHSVESSRGLRNLYRHWVRTLQAFRQRGSRKRAHFSANSSAIISPARDGTRVTHEMRRFRKRTDKVRMQEWERPHTPEALVPRSRRDE